MADPVQDPYYEYGYKTGWDECWNYLGGERLDELQAYLENVKVYAQTHELREMISYFGWGEEDE